MAENFDELFNVPLTESTEAVAAAAASSSSTAGTSNTAAANRDRSGSSTTVSLDNSTASSGSINELVEYRPLNYHWFYSSSILDKLIWIPMSFKDSENLEKAYADKKEQIRELRKNPSGERKSNHIVTVKGGRFEVDLVELIRRPIYWDEEKTCFVKRCLWFYKENNEEFMPYDEDYCEFLEIEYEKSLKNNTFHKRIDYIRIVDIDAESAEKNKQTDQQQQQQQQQKQQEKQQEKKPEERQQSVCLEEAFVFHSASVMLHYTQAAHSLDELGNLMTSDARRPRVVKRGLDDVISRDKIEPDELDRVDHVCFVVHGIGEGCDLKFRTLVECVDDFRDLSAFIIDSHLRQHVEQNNLQGRIEFIPITWHDELHGDATGVDERLKPITLPSIPKLRQYSNTTILDVLFYTSPIYCQTIISKVGNELNRLYQVFIERNPYFCGNVSLVGHSLGSLILFDLLLHQSDAASSSNASPSNQMTSLENMNLQQHEEENIAQKSTAETSVKAVLERLKLNEYSAAFEREKISMDSLYMLSEFDLVQMGLPMGPRRVLMHEIRNRLLQREREEVGKKIKTNLKRLREAQAQAANNADENKSPGDYFNYGLAGTGQLIIKYPQLYFKAKNFFALGSPIAVFLAVRGIEKLSTDFKLPTCDGFFNIFHPYDPIAYRFEPLINKAPVILPVLMPHHKGRKRLHLELKENFNKVSEDLKQKVVEQFRTTWSSLTEFAKMPRLGNSAATAAVTGNTADDETAALITAVQQTESSEAKTSSEETQPIGSIVGETNVDAKYDLGRLNNGRRIDYILQERPIESFNEYLFALASHACYWESEDTVLLLVKEVYGVGNTIDANTELSVSEQQQQIATWFTQTASLPLKQFSTYLGTFGNLGNFSNFVMPSIGSVINRAPNSTSTASANTTTAASPTTSSNASNTQKTEPNSDKSSK